MSSFNPTTLVEVLEKAGDLNLCPNRIWQVCSQIKSWEAKQSTVQSILDGLFPKDALRHEDHSACTIDFCEFSSRNFAAVQQYHEPRTCEESDQTNKIHERRGACFPLRNLFHDAKLIRALKSEKPTAWHFDGVSLLEQPKPFMAISHVWSDGTGTGNWPSKQVHECLFGYFKQIAKRFQCAGIWWDTLCVPQDRDARSKALSIMHHNYQYARVTLVHDRFLRNVPFEGPNRACLAIVLSPWFTRGWTALELAKSRKVKVIFKDSIKDLDKHILNRAEEGNFAAEAIRYLRRDRFSNMEDLLATLGPRYSSWLKDRATIAGLLIGCRISDTNKDTFQRDIYQSILKKIGRISHDHLFHKSVTMSKSFSWCATNLFHLPHTTTQERLNINDAGEVSGPWRLLPVDQFDPQKCLWGNSHELIEAQLQYALERESGQHLLLVKPSEEGPVIEETKKGILVKILKNPSQASPRFKCQFVGSLYFSSALPDNGSATREMTIGNTEGWEDLNEHENAWHILEKENNLLPDNRAGRSQGMIGSQTANPETEPGWKDWHRAAWLGDRSMTNMVVADLAQLQQRDKLGRRAIHLAAERGHTNFIEMLLNKNDDPNSPIHSDSSDPNYNSPDNGQTPLHRAAWGGSLEIVKLLLSRGSDSGAADKRGITALHIAADMGFGDVVEHLSGPAQARVEVQGPNGLTPLHYGARSGHRDVVEVLTTRGAPVDVRDSKIGWTPLHFAAENGQVSVIDLLLDKGAKVDDTDDKVGWAPLHIAAMSGQTAAVEKLIERADINKEDENGFTPLIFATINRHISVVKTLMSHGAAIGNNSTFDWNPEDVRSSEAVIKWLNANGEKFRARISSARWCRIYLAAMDGHTKITSLVVDDHADISEDRAENGDMLLHRAAGDGRLGTVRLLTQIGTAQWVEDKDGRTPLWRAAMAGHAGVTQVLLESVDTGLGNMLLAQAVEKGHEVAVRTLIRAGTNTEAQIRQGETLLFEAVRKGNEGVVQALCETGADIDAATARGDTPLLLAVITGRREGVTQRLLEAGANLEAKNKHGYTPLSVAAGTGQEETIRILLRAGANLEAMDRYGYTPLFQAAKSGQEKVVQMLLEAGARIEARNHHGDTPLSSIASEGHKVEGVLRLLLKAGADIEATNKRKRTPLLAAAESEGESKGIIRILLEAGANIEAADNYGKTPLLAAAEWGQKDAVQILMQAGANIEAATVYKNTPLIAATKFGVEQSVLMLLEAGANIEATNDTGSTPLLTAAGTERKNKYIVQRLLKAGANIEAADESRHTPLLRVLNGGNTSDGIVKILLEAGANIEATNTSGCTPLLLAAEYGHESAARALIEKGANTKAKDIYGNTPLSLAIQRGQKAIIQALEGTNEETR